LGYPRWALPTTVLFGARTFLGNAATVQPTHLEPKTSPESDGRKS